MNKCCIKYKLAVIVLLITSLGSAGFTWYRNTCGFKGCIQSTKYTNWRISKLQNTCPGISKRGIVGANIKYPVFVGVALKGADFSGSDFGNMNEKYKGFEEFVPNFAGAYLENCKFIGSILTRANFSGMPSCGINALVTTTKIIRCNFEKADMKYSNVTACEVVECNFNEANLQGAYSNRLMLSVCDVADVGVIFRRCTFVESNMKYCKNLNILDSDLSKADLRGSEIHLVNCLVQGANVCGLDLRPIVYGKSKNDAINALKHVIYDNTTIWPDGIGPEQCDAIRYEIGIQSIQ